MQKTTIVYVVLGLVIGVNLLLSLFVISQIRSVKKDIVGLQSVVALTPTSVLPSVTPGITIVEHPLPTNIPVVISPTLVPRNQVINPPPSQAVKVLPSEIQGAYSWPVQSVCTENSAYKIYYQLDDGTNIYTKNGSYVRGKSVICTN